MNCNNGTEGANSCQEEACTTQRKACQKGHKHLQQEILQQEGCWWPNWQFWGVWSWSGGMWRHCLWFYLEMGQTGMGIVWEEELDMSLDNHITNCWSQWNVSLSTDWKLTEQKQHAFMRSICGFGCWRNHFWAAQPHTCTDWKQWEWLWPQCSPV